MFSAVMHKWNLFKMFTSLLYVCNLGQLMCGGMQRVLFSEYRQEFAKNVTISILVSYAQIAMINNVNFVWMFNGGITCNLE